MSPWKGLFISVINFTDDIISQTGIYKTNSEIYDRKIMRRAEFKYK